MKNKYILLLMVLLFSKAVNAQVLFHETFDTYKLGNLSTDPTGVLPGQGGWFTTMPQIKNNTMPQNSSTQIIDELGRGKVLQFSNQDRNPYYSQSYVKLPRFNELINKRNTGNNVLFVEFEFFTGPDGFKDMGLINFFMFILGDYERTQLSKNLMQSFYYFQGRKMHATGKDVNSQTRKILSSTKQAPQILNPETWYTIQAYIDFDNKKFYEVMPYYTSVVNIFKNETDNNLLDKYNPKNLYLQFLSEVGVLIPDQNVSVKVDNIKVTALKSVPPHVLSTPTILSTQFNIYPNPAKNLVTIQGTQQQIISQVEIVEASGKIISTSVFNNQQLVNINVENLASGVYYLHVSTTEGIAIKKMIKN